VLNDQDNCPDDPNPDQEDANDDGVGDACDQDADGVRDDQDNCPQDANPDQEDLDGDDIGDVCDDDRDGDEALNDQDNCPDDANPQQEDLDEDGQGDLCDDDRDGDEALNDDDNCPDHPNQSQADLDEDGIGDACDRETIAEQGIPELPDDLEQVTTESGLGYYEREEGNGPQPETGDLVQAHYTGWLEDGTKFDSSLDRGQPFEFTLGVGQVIPGWDEGMGTMRQGGWRRLIIPPDLGYGEGGSPPSIPPNATLIFDVELLAVNP
jgi:FKBP-type peptidyl-prolyl cis-trans isomerase